MLEFSSAVLSALSPYMSTRHCRNQNKTLFRCTTDLFIDAIHTFMMVDSGIFEAFTGIRKDKQQMHFTMHTEKNLHRCEWDTQDRYMITDAVRSVLTAHLDTIQK